MNLQVPITIIDELSEVVVRAKGLLDLASGEIRRVEYEDYDIDRLGLPVHDEAYEFTVGLLSNAGKDVEFRIDVDRITGTYSVSASELLEVKVRAAKLFGGMDGKAMLREVDAHAKPANPAAARKRLH